MNINYNYNYEYFRATIKAIETKFDNPLIDAINDPSGNVAVAIDMDSYRVLKSIFGKAPRKIDFDLFNTVKGIGVSMNNHAYWLVKKTMSKLVPAGIPQHIRNTIYDFHLKHAQPPITKSPKVFNIEDLSFGFVVWLIAISIALVAFLLEIVWFHGVVGLMNVFGLYFLLSLIQRRTRKFY